MTKKLFDDFFEAAIIKNDITPFCDSLELKSLRGYCSSIWRMLENPLFKKMKDSQLNLVGKEVRRIHQNPEYIINEYRLKESCIYCTTLMNNIYYYQILDKKYEDIDFDFLFFCLECVYGMFAAEVLRSFENYTLGNISNEAKSESGKKEQKEFCEIFENDASILPIWAKVNSVMRQHEMKWGNGIYADMESGEAHYNGMVINNLFQNLIEEEKQYYIDSLKLILSEFRMDGDATNVMDRLNNLYRHICLYTTFYNNYRNLYVMATVKNKPMNEVIFPSRIYFGHEMAFDCEQPHGKPAKIRDIKIDYKERVEKTEVASPEMIHGHFRKKPYRIGTLREGIGLDKCSFNCTIQYIDEQKLMDAIENKSMPSDPEGKKGAWILVNRTNTKSGSYILADIVSEEFMKRYPLSSLKIQITSYAHLEIKLVNCKKKTNKLYSTILKINVNSKEVLGNFQNYSVKECQEVVRETLVAIKDNFGINIPENSVHFQTIEINNTFAFEYSMNELKRQIDYAAFENGEISLESKGGRESSVSTKRKRMDMTQKERETKDKRKKQAETKWIRTKCKKNVEFIVYDKGRETGENDNKNPNVEVLPPFADGRGIFVRLEFRITDARDIYREFEKIGFTKENEKVGLFDIQQEDIVKLYRFCVDFYFEKAYESFVKKMEPELIKLLATTDMSKRGWEVEFLKRVYSQELFCNTTPMIVSANDLDELMKYDSHFNGKNYQRNLRRVHELLEDHEDYPIGNNNAYSILTKFIHTAKMEYGICEEREVRFIVHEK